MATPAGVWPLPALLLQCSMYFPSLFPPWHLEKRLRRVTVRDRRPPASPQPATLPFLCRLIPSPAFVQAALPRAFGRTSPLLGKVCLLSGKDSSRAETASGDLSPCACLLHSSPLPCPPRTGTLPACRRQASGELAFSPYPLRDSRSRGAANRKPVQSPETALTLPSPAGLIAPCLAVRAQCRAGLPRRSRFRHLDRRWAFGAYEGSE
jgi:hypothetical protein